MDTRCQQFTSRDIANEMLDLLDYKHNLYGKRVLENSCGEGNILCLIVERYIQDALNNGISRTEIVSGLQRDIYGAEINTVTYDKCIENLNRLTEKYSLRSIDWNIYNGDVLTFPFEGRFDYIIGNPPYIAYRNLEIKDREYIKKNYSTCTSGKPDYCYAFIENAIRYLKEDGSMVYLIPNSIYKNVYAQDLRKLMLGIIVEIRDYPNRKLFDNALTSSAIMLIKNGDYSDKLQYVNVPKRIHTLIDKKRLVGKWVFEKREEHKNTFRFGDFFNASAVIATQRNNVFVIDEKKKNDLDLEDEVLRPAISPRNRRIGKTEYIIFPYQIINDDVINYTESVFKEKYPKVYNYLEKNKKELKQRAADRAAKWFEYGRSQALKNMNKNKLMVSTVVTDCVYVYDVGQREIPYAGIYIVSKGECGLEVAKKILESASFLEYIKGIGTPASGSSLRITASDINNYLCSTKDLHVIREG